MVKVSNMAKASKSTNKICLKFIMNLSQNCNRQMRALSQFYFATPDFERPELLVDYTEEVPNANTVVASFAVDIEALFV